MISVENLSYRPPSTDEKETRYILSDITFKIGGGEFVSIVGRNGAGKTTLIRHLNGILTPTHGRVIVNGMDTRLPENLTAIRKMIGMVFQQPEDQIIASTVEDDVAFGLENSGIPPREIRSRVDLMLEQMGLADLKLRPPHFLSAGQMQRLALAGVMILRPGCIVFDEVTAMLDPRGRRTVLRMMENLHQQGVTVIFITHAMDEAALSNRMIILHQGSVVADGPPVDLMTSNVTLEKYGLEQPPAALLANRLKRFFPSFEHPILTIDDLSSRLPACDFNCTNSAAVPLVQKTLAEMHLDVEVAQLDHTYLAGTPLAHQALKNASLSVFSGEAHGVIGATGSGKSTLIQHLNGLLRPQAGQVRSLDFNLNDPRIKIKSIVEKVGMVFQNPDLQFFKQYVGDEIAFGPRQYQRTDALKDQVRWAMETAGLDFMEFKDRLLYTLSGGEKRKVALASALALKPALLLLDEPTAGLDPISRRELIDHLKILGSGGMTMVISSHRMEDLVAMVQNLTVFQRGSTLVSGSREQVFSNLDDLDSAGLEPPIAALAAHMLRLKGWPLPFGIISGTMLARSLAILSGVSNEPV